MEHIKEKVLITGITGYIGAWVGKMLIDNGKDRFTFRASVRNLKDTKKLDPLREEYGEMLFNQIEFVQADLKDLPSLVSAISGVQYIVHVASPVPREKNLTEDEMVGPAKEGMKTIIEAAVNNKVKRIVVTNSLASILGNGWKRQLGDFHYTEEDIAPFETADSYGRSKIAQEKVIRDFLNQQSKQDEHDYKLEIVTLHPTFVIGPTLITGRNSSAELVARIMKRKVPGMPLLILPTVDVRDVGMAHYLALINPGVNGRRFLITKETLSLIELAHILDEEFQQYGYRVQKKVIGMCPLKLASIVMGQIKIILPLVGQKVTADNTLSREVLGLKYEYEIRQTVIDMGYSLISKGLVPDKITQQKKKMVTKNGNSIELKDTKKY